MPDNIRFDIDRDVRIGLPEAVFCEGKSHDALLSLIKRFASDDEKPILFTRLSESVWARLPKDLRASYDYDPLSRTAWHRTCPRHETGLASIVSAGTADAFVTHEVARTLEYLGWTVRLFEDCGVAGLWRIQAARDDINKGDVVVVCAGLDAALASVMGVAEGGRAALSSCLASCAPGVAVMNIDNGYGAACAAARVLTLLESVRAAR